MAPANRERRCRGIAPRRRPSVPYLPTIVSGHAADGSRLRTHQLRPRDHGGQPCVRGMRLTVRRVLEILAQYPDWDELIRDYPELERQDVPEVLRFATEMLDEHSANPTPPRSDAA
ncbi:MAG: DUF433 domain-containing protein [Myxococcota bacterium]